MNNLLAFIDNKTLIAIDVSGSMPALDKENLLRLLPNKVDVCFFTTEVVGYETNIYLKDAKPVLATGGTCILKLNEFCKEHKYSKILIVSDGVLLAQEDPELNYIWLLTDINPDKSINGEKLNMNELIQEISMRDFSG